MALFFLDSSALVKRYVAETGTVWIRALTDPAAGHELFVSHITGVEVVSALIRHTPPLGSVDLTTALRDFQLDFRGHYRKIRISRALVRRAMVLATAHRLRAYDAVQLAAALVLQRRNTVAGGLPPILLSADVDLNTAAAAEGYLVDNPNHHP